MVPIVACSSDARSASWGEVDMSRGITIVQAAQMTAQRAYRVPLSARALEVLGEAEQFADGSGFVSPSPRDKPLSDSTLS